MVLRGHTRYLIFLSVIYNTASLGFFTDLISVSVSIIWVCTLLMSICGCSKCNLAVTSAQRWRTAYDIVNRLPCRVFRNVCGVRGFSVRLTYVRTKRVIRGVESTLSVFVLKQRDAFL